MKKKTMLAGLMSACILSSAAVAVTAASAADIVYGDANGDGTVDMSDAVLVMQSLANPSKYGVTGSSEGHLTQEGADRADVFERGSGLTSSDALSIQRYLLNAITALPESYKDMGGQTTAVVTTTAVTTTTETVVTVPKEDVNTKIHLNGNSITVDGKYATANGSNVTISHSGTFTIDGTLNDGQIYVEVPDDKADPDTVKLVLSGAKITGKSAPAILIKNADKTSITIADGTENTISDTETAYAGDFLESAVIEAKDDLTIKGGDAGTGVLTITANVQPAIVCNNDIKITGGTLNIDALNMNDGNDAVKGKTSLVVKGGALNINAEGDGLKSSKGNVDIEGGTVVIKSGKDAIQAETDINISGGDISACGDKSLTSAGAINLTGGTIVATATDCQIENLTSTAQSAMLLDFAKEWSKNNPIAVTDSSNKIIIETNTVKKYKFALVSSPDLADGTSYKVFAGGIKQKHSSGNTFKAGKPASFKDVNNDMENDEQLYGQLFDQTSVHKVEVKMSENDWNNFMKVAQQEEWAPCDVIIDGEEIKNVGIRTKGNSSRMMVQNGKYSFRFKLDKYEKLNNYHGLTEFCVNNFYSDPSCMRDIICYNAMYEIDGVAPLAGYSDMYLNGKLYSFYMIAEQPGTTLAERYAIDDDTNLYKATERSNQAGGGGFGGFGGGDSYSTFTEKMPVNNLDLKFGKDEQLAHLEELKSAINKLNSSNYKFIEDIMDVPSFLKGFAVNAVMCNYDSYNGSLAHNYYLIYTGGKHYFVGWDYNLCLGNFMGGTDSVNSDITTSLYQATVDNRPFAKLLQVPEYYDMYVGYVKDILNYYSDPEAYVSKYADMIRPHVQADPLSAFTVDQFNANTTKSANGIQVNTNTQQGNNQWNQQQGNNQWNQQQGNNQWNQQQDNNQWNQQQGNNQWNQQQGNNQWNQQQGNWGFQFNSDEPDTDTVTTEESWAFEGGFGGFGGFGGGGFGGGGFGGGGFGGFGGGGGGMFNNNTSVIDFLIARFQIIRSALKF
ncbi:MAG: carbohydrate-binding domain-containing protein [Ruminococcus sp.]|uniref:carbohydrate-binding domain-containing protein n=1 Tax=Ruminococcus sp. TaxID=41978 RepID=UPI0025D5E250|nr:carbohydrate-binding domain-containing protein [Ruminococcus sp.]MCR4794898.1 carbohydrate-binding domain-containing protein [Ruminococcus sp.]